jgi:hypothetical protein
MVARQVARDVAQCNILDMQLQFSINLLQDKLHGGTSPKACLWEKFPDVIVRIVASVKFPKKIA